MKYLKNIFPYYATGFVSGTIAGILLVTVFKVSMLKVTIVLLSLMALPPVLKKFNLRGDGITVTFIANFTSTLMAYFILSPIFKGPRILMASLILMISLLTMVGLKDVF